MEKQEVSWSRNEIKIFTFASVDIAEVAKVGGTVNGIYERVLSEANFDKLFLEDLSTSYFI